MHFSKMQGVGNDFVMVDCLGTSGADTQETVRGHAILLCDRRFGVGADGVILVLPASAPTVTGVETAGPRFRMVMYNPDGSEAEMCGNGIRCFAKFLVDRGHAGEETHLAVETGAGLLYVDVIKDGLGKVSTVRVDMGEPVLDPKRIPTTLTETDTAINVPLEVGGTVLRFTAVSMGNPHAVTFVDSVAHFPVGQIGPLVENHPAFPRRTNTEFVEIVSQTETRFRVWERGAAETLACGTGACASVVAGSLNGLTGRNVTVHLPGGDLWIEWSEADNHVYMTGPAADVFEGDIVF